MASQDPVEFPGARSEPPPYVLGERGAPLEAPENTLAGLRRALEVGADGFACDVRATADDELILLADEDLDRTTDGKGPVMTRGLAELFGLDAGTWVARNFAGEPVPTLEEALSIAGHSGRPAPAHLLLLKRPHLAAAATRVLSSVVVRRFVRVGCVDRESALELTAAGHPAILHLHEPDPEALAFALDHRICGVSISGSWGEVVEERFAGLERWVHGLSDPDALLEATRLPVFGISTPEPHRALAARDLHDLVPVDRGPWPVRAPVLGVTPEHEEDGAWRGTWEERGNMRNPFPFPVRARAKLFVRQGAFEISELPEECELAPGEELVLPFRLTGGARSPGADPLLAVRYSWDEGPERPAGSLVLDAPMPRVRVAVADPITQRLPLLHERSSDVPASVTLRRRGEDIVVQVENPGGLEDVELSILLGSRLRRGGRGMRAGLPAGFDDLREGVPFSVAIEGRPTGGGARVLRRWSGGLPDEPRTGAPGRLLSLQAAGRG
ncbi:MAG: glycerophosphodiester phosphodiesterase family protein [Planctomycetota bacterium]|nr:glycerophosphodiester phosphodiesterase family protein [Planctomycetota bacterium]